MSKPTTLPMPAPRYRLLSLPRLPLTAMVALGILLLIIAMALFAPWVANHDPVTLSPATIPSSDAGSC